MPIRHFRITKQISTWLASFLCGRKQNVQIPGGISGCGQASSVVPRGAVLGPVLFLILIADITKMLNSPKISSFADDTRLILLLSHY